MTLAERIASFFSLSIESQQRSVYPAGVSIDEQVLNLRRRHQQTQAWNSVSIQEALGVPAIFGAVSLIANTVGSLSLEAFRQGVALAQENAPRLIIRPNPFTTPRAFFRDTAFHLATRGEAWWWIAARDIDGEPLSLYPIPPWEITVAQNERNRLKPTISWGNKVMPNEDIRHITYLPDHAGLRGVGPMQLCGAAMSVTVEAQEWAANFYSGSVPSVIGTTEQDMSDEELDRLNMQWNEKPPNTPRWLTSGLKLEESPFDAGKAQLTEQRQHQVGEAARMFSMPGALIEYQMGGSSLTYQNQADIWNDFQRRCLSPHYLEPIEQEISDLLTRATVARFNLKQLLRADPKSRAEVYEKLVPIGVITAEEARKDEGLEPGAVDFAPVPLALPQATPSLLPINRTAAEIRCQSCHRMLAEAATPPYRFTCPKCKTVNEDYRTAMSPSLDALDGIKLAIHSLANPPVVNVEAPPAPVINVEAPPAPKVYITSEPFAQAIRELKETMRPRKITRIPIRDEAGRIIRVDEEVA